jgi:glycosyltransferase involved in cell wall biosynthesis
MVQSSLYYFLKPLIPRAVQIKLRRRVVLAKRSLYRDVWPIDECAATAPPGWGGWPEGKKFAFVITHDVETARGHEKAYKLAKLDRELGFRSSFNFVPEGYTVSDSLRRDLVKHGFEVGVHGLTHSGQIYASRDTFSKKVDRIKHYLKEWDAVGFRTPSMYHNLDLYHDLELEYDASTFDTDPFEPQPDGVGTIFPFWVPRDSGNDGYVELPYTLPQDFGLFVLMGERNTGIWKSKLDWIARNGGMALFLAHPDYMHFDGKRRRSDEYPAALYKEFLEFVKAKYEGQYWHTLPREVARFWKAHYAGPQPAAVSPVTRHPSPVPSPSALNTQLQSPVTQGARRPLRVCMLSYSFYDVDARVSRYAETLVRRGDHVDVISIGQEAQADFEKMNGVNVYRIQTRERNERGKFDFASRLLKFLVNSSRFLNKMHRKNPYDVIHVHSVPDFEVFAAWLPKVKGAKVILDIHDIVPEFYAAKFGTGKDSVLYKMLILVERLSGAFSDHLIISNHLWQKTLCRSVNGEKCSVIMNYPDETTFYSRPRANNNGKFIMMYPGTLAWHQGLDIAVKAVDKIKETIPEAELHIYGKGESRDAIAALIKELGLQERVFLHDMLPKEQIAEVMAEADLGIVPKRNDSFGGEAFSTKILEFMALGVPVVVSATKIDRHYFNDSVVRFFEPENETSLAAAIVELARDKELRKDLAGRAKAFVEQGYDWKEKKELYLNIVDSLAARGR